MSADTLRPRIAALADQCVMCGLCLPYCPTYALDGDETESPRGRIALARALASGTMELTAANRLPLDHCLGCLTCERVCPSGVHYGELLTATRALLGPRPRRARALLGVLKRPRRLRALARLGAALGAPHWAPRLARLLPDDSAWGAVLGALPPLPAAPSPPSHPTAAATRGRVALFPGCVADVYETEAHAALERLLAAAGFEPVRLPALCCGALDRHGGEAAAGAREADAVRAAWAAAGAHALLTATPGCLGTLREALPQVVIEDAMAFVEREGAALRFRALPLRAALHLPCTEVNVARSDGAVRRLLARVPGLELLPLPAQPACCGAAGSHVLDFPQRARALRALKLDQALALAPQRLLSGNIGCRLHLAAGLAERGSALPVEHPLSLLARQLESP